MTARSPDNAVHVISDALSRRTPLSEALARAFRVTRSAWAPGLRQPCTTGSTIILDPPSDLASSLDALRAWDAAHAAVPKIVIMLIDRADRSPLIRSGVLRGANLLTRPVDPMEVVSTIRMFQKRAAEVADSPSTAPRALAAAPHGRAPLPIQPERLPSVLHPAVAPLRAADQALDGMWRLAHNPSASLEPILDQAEVFAQSFLDTTLDAWTQLMRLHHNATYQHCHLVTGTLVAFGQHIGCNARDLTRLAIGGLMHDLGKMRIPEAILDKPGKLTEDELQIMRRHPEEGHAILALKPEISTEILDIVLLHHELIDGSGYPFGYSGEQIPDLVRLATIADIFAALIEWRPYKPPLSGASAVAIMDSMGDQLDRALFRAVRPVMLSITDSRPAMIAA